ncbi:MAG: ABC transporter permease subunit [Mycobacterium leprae]
MGLTLLRLWLNRLLLFILAGTFVVVAIYAPTGKVIVKQTEQRQGNIRYTMTEFRWDFATYRQHLAQYITDLRTGHLRLVGPKSSTDTYNAREANLPQILRPGQEQDFLPLLKDGWLASLELFAVAVVLSALLGVAVGAVVALRGRLFHNTVLGLAVLALCLADFFVVVLLQFAVPWIYRHTGIQVAYVLAGPGSFKGWVMPVIGLCLAPAAYGAQLTINALDEVMREEYIRTARSKGVPERLVVMKHAFKNVALRLLAGYPPILNVVLTSAIVVERMTVWPGLTKWFFGYGDMPMATVAVCYVAWYLVLDGLAASARVWAGKAAGQEVAA